MKVEKKARVSPDTNESGLQNQRADKGQKPGKKDTAFWRQILMANMRFVPAAGPMFDECAQALDDPHFSDERGNVLANIVSDRANREDA